MKFICFGELMLRLVPVWRGERIADATLLRVTFGGSEANVAVALVALGKENKVIFLSSLPKNSLGMKALSELNSRGVAYKNLPSLSEKIGLYWVELGEGSRSSEVLYDRYNSAFEQANFGSLQKKDLRCDWFHASGVTLGISKRTADALFRCLEFLSKNTPISFDLNYRGGLWQWTDSIQMRRYYEAIVSKVTLLAGNENDFQTCLRVESNGNDISEIYSGIAEQLFGRYKQLKFISISLRQSRSATQNSWSGMFFVKTKKTVESFSGIQLEIDSIVDRLGTGDSFLAGILYGLTSFKQDYQKTLDFAIALSSLNHTTFGDFSRFSQKEVFESLHCTGSGRIKR